MNLTLKACSNELKIPENIFIPLAIRLFTYDDLPRSLDYNIKGEKILRGRTEKDMIKGKCEYKRLQIRDVTSHYTRGFV